MLRLRSDQDDSGLAVLHVEPSGEFSAQDFSTFLDALRRYDGCGGARVLLTPDGLTGVETDALWARLRVAVPPIVCRVAVVGDRPWERRYARVVASAHGVPARYFPSVEHDDASRWLCSEVPEPQPDLAPSGAVSETPPASADPADAARIDAVYDALDLLVKDTLGVVSPFEHAFLARLQWFSGTLAYLWWQEHEGLEDVLGSGRDRLRADPALAQRMEFRHRALVALVEAALEREMAAGRLRFGDTAELAPRLLHAAFVVCSLAVEGAERGDLFRDKLRAHAAVLAHLLFDRIRAVNARPLATREGALPGLAASLLPTASPSV
ncbi:MAG: STAS/SEC14 domain-containing protein [Rhodothermales bacterium]